MKKHVSSILTVACFVLMIVVLIQNQGLKDQIRQMENDISNRLYQVENSVNGITYNIETKLNEAAALLSSSEWRLGDVDVQNGTVEALLTVVPKEYQPDKTNATIICNSTEYPMILKDGSYCAEITIPLYEASQVESVGFETNGVIRTEVLNWGINPRYDVLPVVYAHYAGGASGSRRNGNYELSFDGEMEVIVDQKEDAPPVQSVELVEMLNGKEIGRQDVSGKLEANGSIWFELEQKQVIFPYGSTYGMYVEVEDGYGLLHRAWAWREKISETGEPVDDDHWWWRGAEGSIFSPDGEPLAVHDGEFFQ